MAVVLRMLIVILLLCSSGSALAAGAFSLADPPGIISWAAPAEEALSDEYKLLVNGESVPVYACRVSAVPLNQVWPGYQRPLDQTELAGFASWDMSGPVRVEIQSQRAVQSVVVRPAVLGINPEIEGNRISFSLDSPRPLVVEINGPHGALHLFANPPEKDAPASDAAGVRYFGPGVHRPGRIELTSNETVYLAGGAVVYGSIHATQATNLRIAGRGILDVGPFERGEGGGAIRLSDCSDVVIEGLVMRDPDVWCCSLFGCRRVTISNVKLVGLWRYNADGIDVCNSQDVVVSDSFVRAFDDALVIKGLKFPRNSFDDRPVRNVQFLRCVIWCDWGRAIEIGAETCAPEIENITFADCDIVRTTHIAIDIQHGDRAAIRDIRFERIRVEIDDQNPAPRMQQTRDETYPVDAQSSYCPTLLEIVIRKNFYSKDEDRGTVRDILFQDITVLSRLQPASSFRGFDPEHTVEGVTIRNLRFNDRAVCDATEAHLTVGPHVRDVQFSAAAAGGSETP
ncbi:MAG: glycosyl hydrolase family 28 protein [Pirellulaceae bacterium]